MSGHMSDYIYSFANISSYLRVRAGPLRLREILETTANNDFEVYNESPTFPLITLSWLQVIQSSDCHHVLVIVIWRMNEEGDVSWD